MKLRLSEAIRLGSMLKPQGRGAFYEGGHTCAIGAAIDAVGGFENKRVMNYYRFSEDRWPILTQRVVHPVAGGERFPLWRAIESLNDVDRWSREQIADWVATIEQSLESQVSRVLSPGEEEKRELGNARAYSS